MNDSRNPHNASGSSDGNAIVVGIVGDIHEVGGGEDGLPQRSTVPHVYRALTVQRPNYFAVRAADGGGARLLPAFRAAFAAVDPDIPIDIGDSVDSMLRGRFAQERFLTQLMLALASIALFLAAIGIYSVVSNAAERRTREMGIRVALGAAGGDIIALMMRRAMLPVALGVVVGLGGSLAAAGLLRTQLFEVTPTDPVVLFTVTTLPCAATLLASYVPARRATRVDPTTVLREE